MKLYHYIPKEVDVTTKGILSVSKIKPELRKYAKRAGSKKSNEILMWLEQTFPGRSRAISVLTEPVQWQGNDPMLKEWLVSQSLVEIDYDALLNDGLIEAVWCKTESQAGGFDEKFYPVAFNEIDTTPLPWRLCSRKKGLFFGAVRHYFLVMKNGLIPPNYIRAIK